jgi:hypothetical protein
MNILPMHSTPSMMGVGRAEREESATPTLSDRQDSLGGGVVQHLLTQRQSFVIAKDSNLPSIATKLCHRQEFKSSKQRQSFVIAKY